jgi:hypothetical protein
MISQEYLSRLDQIGISRGYEFIPTAELLEELQYEWKWLKNAWAVKGTDNLYHHSAITVLSNLAEISYELLARLTHYEWDEVISAAKDLHVRKNAGYSPEDTDAWANFRECTQFGISAADGCLVRLCDKYRRFFNVYTNPENDQVSESAIDTLKDLAAYSIILAVLLEEEN